MELHQLQQFVDLAKELNYTTAAKKCFISRQALRQTVQALEKEYGVSLVLNRRNKLFLTPAGELLAIHARQVLSACTALNEAMRSFVSKPHTLRLGISISLLPFYAPELLSLLNHLSEPFPTLEIERTLTDSDSLLMQLEAGAIDAAILVDMGCEIPGLHRTVLRRDKPGVLIRADHPLATRRQMHLEDLDGQTLALMSAPTPCFRPLVDVLHDRGIQTDFRVIPESIEAFRAVRREGIWAIDRMEHQPDDPVALEIDLPLPGFTAELETVMLCRESTIPELSMLANYLQKTLVI